jgi:hypothetical protein
MSTLARQAKTHAEDLLEVIDKQKRNIARAFYDLGSAIKELNAKKLFGVLGYESFDQMLTERNVMSSSQARKLIEVVRVFEKQTALEIGPEKAYALARHVARTKQDDDPIEYVKRGFPLGGHRRPIDEVSVREIVDATRVAVRKQKGQYGQSERARKDAEIIAGHVRAALRQKTEDEAQVELAYRRGSWWVKVTLPAEMSMRALGIK